MGRKVVFVCLILFSVFMFGCSSEPTQKPRTFEKTYKVIDAQSPLLPTWLDNPHSYAQKEKEFRYFTSSTDMVKNRRLCIKSSQTRAKSQIAGEITELIKNQYTESVEGTKSDMGENFMSEAIASEARAYLTGVQVVQNYWEKRRYAEELGAE
ncbi:MAG: hypothetical protein ACOCUT_03465, partial [bacterium]